MRQHLAEIRRGARFRRVLWGRHCGGVDLLTEGFTYLRGEEELQVGGKDCRTLIRGSLETPNCSCVLSGLAGCTSDRGLQVTKGGESEAGRARREVVGTSEEHSAEPGIVKVEVNECYEERRTSGLQIFFPRGWLSGSFGSGGAKPGSALQAARCTVENPSHSRSLMGLN